MKKTLLFLIFTLVGSTIPIANCENNMTYSPQDKKVFVCTNDNLTDTWWYFIDVDGTGIVLHFISDGWVRFYAFKRNDNMASEWDTYYKVTEREMFTYQIDQSNGNTGTIWEVEGDRREVFGTFVMSGNTMGFTNKTRTLRWTLKNDNTTPECDY